MYAKMKHHKLIAVGWKVLEHVNIYIAMVLPPAAAGVIVLLIVYYGVEWEVGRRPPTGWSSYTPTSLISGLLMVLMLGGTTLVTYQGARKHPTLANSSTAAGIATTTTLSWATQQCNWIGGIVAGLTAAGTIIVVATVVRALMTGSVEQGVTALRQTEEPRTGTEGIISAMQIGMAISMGIVVLIALLHDHISSSARPLLLVFAGVGMMAAATVSSEATLKNCMVIAGMIISLAGSYIQIDQVIAAADESSSSASEIMLLTVISAFVPFTIFASQKHWIVRVVTVPMLAAVIVFSIVIFVTMIPALFIFQECNTGDNALIPVLAVISIIAGFFGVAAFCFVLLALVLGKVKSQTQLDDGYM